ncbi:MAG: M3 family metallopeptidase [Planctomycetota bacterium]
MTNPLLGPVGIPAFDRIETSHVVPAIREIITQLQRDFSAFESSIDPAGGYAAVVSRASDLNEPLNWAFGLVHHLLGVRNSELLRTAHQEVQAEVVAISMQIAQSRPMYQALKRLAPSVSGVERRVVDASIRDAELSGVALEGAAKDVFLKNQQELSELSTRFQNQLLDATKAFALDLTDPADVAGLPPSALAGAAAAAQRAGNAEATAERGPWRITLDAPSLTPFLEHAKRRDLRERVYRAFIRRGADAPHDNAPVLARTLELRREQAKLLGYATWAEVSLAQKMAGTVAAVDRLLDELHAAALPKARAEHAELTEFARNRSGDTTLVLAPWDVPFWAERLREERYAYTDEELRPYFALPRVLDGLFALSERLFGIKVEAADGQVSVWHPDVRHFRIRDSADGRALASFYLDPYSRPSDKRGGAWMGGALDRKGDRQPVAYLVCNQTPPIGTTPSLMTFREVETLFHEFGHGLQHMLTTVPRCEAAGINNVEWDAVELPSQFMENWCLHRPTLLGLAKHWQTGAALPDALIDKLKAAKTYRAGSMTLRQLYFSRTDLELHHRFDGKGSPHDVQRRIAATHTVLAPLPEDRSLCAFAHIFAGGYSAGYYSYKWAEVLSADAFAAFEEVGLDNASAVAATGRRFRDTVLALGGSKHPTDVFKAFRGREPSTKALLQHSGLAK